MNYKYTQHGNYKHNVERKKAGGKYKVQEQATLNYAFRSQYRDYTGGGTD